MGTSTELLVEALYDGVLASQAWSDALQAVCDRVGAYAFHQLSLDTRTCTVSTVAASVNSTPPPVDKVLEYETHYAALDVRMPLFMGVREGQIMLDHEHLSASTFSREPIYADFLASLGMRHTACIPARDGHQSRDFVGFMRHVDQRPFGAAERTVLEYLQPHVVRANCLRFRATKLAAQAEMGYHAMEALPQAVVVLSPQCQLRYLNGAARHWLERDAALTVRHGHLLCADAAAQERLVHLVARACGAGPARTAGLLHLRPSHHAAVSASVLPLHGVHPLATMWQAAPQALLTWRCGYGDREEEQLGAMLGLSPVETRLALHLAKGQSVKAFALAHGCSWHTARTHVKNLLRKTGSHSQQELALLVQSLVVL